MHCTLQCVCRLAFILQIPVVVYLQVICGVFFLSGKIVYIFALHMFINNFFKQQYKFNHKNPKQQQQQKTKKNNTQFKIQGIYT